jgi:hypothetical protein
LFFNWDMTHYVAQTGLKVIILPPQLHATIPNLKYISNCSISFTLLISLLTSKRAQILGSDFYSFKVSLLNLIWANDVLCVFFSVVHDTMYFCRATNL